MGDPCGRAGPAAGKAAVESMGTGEEMAALLPWRAQERLLGVRAHQGHGALGGMEDCHLLLDT